MSEQQKYEAGKFAEFWKDKGYEKGQSQSFWLSLLRDVYGVQHPEEYIIFEEQVHLDHTSFIDCMIPATKVLIEQKGIDKDLKKPIRQSDGSLLTPFQQAKRYITELPLSQHPRWVITCNFKSFLVYDMERPNGEPEEIQLEDLPEEYYRLQFLVDTENEHLKKEIEVSIAAGDIVGKLYDALSKQYADPDSPHALHSLNVLCVRIVFCLYAENAEIFGHYGMFREYLEGMETRQIRRGLIDLFHVLDTPIDQRDRYLADDNPKLAAFPYVNGGLFSDETIEIPPFTDDIRSLLITDASSGFNWSDISPTIFGAVFESTLNPETRRSGGMHYTSIENIHKVIDPLFLDDLNQEFEDICKISVERTRRNKLQAFQKKLASLKFLDPACGSGNFLTETYLCLRRLENNVIKELSHGQMMFGDEESNPIQVSLNQFYGIEINDFAVTVAKTALWIAESQMLKETETIVMMQLDFLPLKSYSNIVEGNALRMDWEDVVPKAELNYIIGNPPFVRLSLRNKEQQYDMEQVFKGNNRAGRLDYVAAWYQKAALYTFNNDIQVAFVSTNSIVQGEQVPVLWKSLFDMGIKINFAYRTFAWKNEAKNKASVHCVIIGFGYKENKRKIIFDNGTKKYVDKINGYLVNADNIFIQSRGKPQEGMPKLVQGNKPWDGGNLILSADERNKLIKKYPQADKFIKKYVGSYEFINNKARYCLWLQDVSPAEYRNIPEIMTRLEAVADVRKKTKTEAVHAQADTPMLFSQIRQPETDYIFIPETSSSSRRYIPIGFMNHDVIASNSTLVATNATLFMFGILTSNVHMAWTRTVCGRLGSGYRYSPAIYNNFPWPNTTPQQKEKIEQTAQAILDARNLYPNCSFADLYDELSMPPELRKAHQQNDKAVMAAYGWTSKDDAYSSESACVAELMKLYQKLVKQKTKKK